MTPEQFEAAYQHICRCLDKLSGNDLAMQFLNDALSFLNANKTHLLKN
jgi:hypothetical protein